MLYKLTDAEDRTRGLQWGEGVVHRAHGHGEGLCSSSVIHAYRDPYLAVLMHPIHGQYSPCHMWEAEGRVVEDDGTKVGCRALRTLRRIDPPQITKEQRVEFAIRCVRRVYTEKKWREWADRWLSGEDRSSDAARAAADAADIAAYAAARAVAARAATAAADIAAYAATAAAHVVTRAANATADIAYAARAADTTFDLLSVIGEMQWKS